MEFIAFQIWHFKFKVTHFGKFNREPFKDRSLRELGGRSFRTFFFNSGPERRGLQRFASSSPPSRFGVINLESVKKHIFRFVEDKAKGRGRKFVGGGGGGKKRGERENGRLKAVRFVLVMFTEWKRSNYSQPPYELIHVQDI